MLYSWMNDLKNIAQLFYDSAEKFPHRTAIIDADATISFESLLKEVQNTAAYFTSKGIKSGDRVLVFVPMSIDLYRILLALFSIGATAVFLDEWVSLKRLNLCTQIANCQGFIGVTKSHLLRLVSRSIRRIPIKLKIGGRANSSAQFPFVVSEEISALITFTTGSTGTPKAAVRSHGFLNTQFEILQEKVGSKPSDIEITNLPIVLFINLGVGATTVICNFSPKKADQFNYQKLYETIEIYQVSRLVFSPFLLNEYTNFLTVSDKFNHSINQLFTGGGPVFPNEAKKIIDRFSTSKAEVIFGSTEAEPMSSISMLELSNQDLMLDQGLAVGTPHPEAEIRIIEFVDGPLTQFQELPKNKVGEIIVAGKHVLANYLNNTEAIRRNKIIQNGKVYHRTGDSGYLNANNQLFLTGRCQGIVRVNERSYYPFIIGYELSQIEGVEQGAVIELNDSLTVVVEKSMKCQIPKSTLELEIRSLGFNSERIIWTKIPRDPRHHTKIDSEKLKRQLLKSD